MSFVTLHFDPSFSASVDPEFPGSGVWGCPVFGFDREGKAVDPFLSPWGTPLVVEITTEADDKWVGMFPNGSGTVYATPSPHLACVVGESAWLLDVRDPASGAEHLFTWPTAARSFPELPLLLVAGATDVVAVGESGVAWRSPRLCWDGLRIQQATGNEIRCSGDFGEEEDSFAIDARTGTRTDGRFVA